MPIYQYSKYIHKVAYVVISPNPVSIAGVSFGVAGGIAGVLFWSGWWHWRCALLEWLVASQVCSFGVAGIYKAG